MDKQTQQYLLDLVKRNYDEIAEDFSSKRGENIWPEIAKLASVVKDGDRVLDAGCGNGRLLYALADKQIEYVGIDSSEKLIKEAWEKFQIPNSKSQINSKFKIQNSKFLTGDLIELDKLDEENFDYIFCIAVIHHIPGNNLRIRALEKMKNKLKPGGKMIITVWNMWPNSKFYLPIVKYALMKLIGGHKMDFGDILFPWKNSRQETVSERYYHAFTLSELGNIIKNSGFQTERLYKDRYNYYAILKA